MTRSEITQEPFELLDRRPETKKDVTYVLVQIRKVLEHDKRREGYSGLKFFCDWSLHTKLDWKGAKEVLSTLDERLGHYRPSVPESIDHDGKALEIFWFGLFRRYLLQFFKTYDLPNVWAEDQSVWNKVLILCISNRSVITFRLYVGVCLGQWKHFKDPIHVKFARAASGWKTLGLRDE